MAVGIHRRAVGVFPHRRDVENALQELRSSGFPMDRVSVIKRDADRKDEIAGAEVRENVGNKADEGATAGAVSGGVLGGLTGLLVGLGTLAIPGIGPIMLAGATATALATTLAGAGIGAATGGVVGALIGLGIPEERARVYNERLERGDYLVIIDGTDAEIARARDILTRGGVQEFAVYDRPEHKQGTATPVAATPGVVGAVPNATPHTHRRRRAIGVFPNRRDAEVALTELRDAGFPLSQISLIAKDGNHNTNLTDTAVGRGNKADEGAKAGAVTGGALGGLGGLLVGLGALAIPGIGPVIAGGAVATALATTAAGAGIGAAAGGVTGGLVGLGIPENRAKVYNDRLNRGDYLIIVDGTDDEVRRAEAILKRHGIQEFDTFDAADTTGVHRHDSDRDIHPVVGAAPHTHRRRRAIGVFPNRRDAEVALTELRDAGFPLSQISLIAKDGNHNTNLTDTAVGRGNKADEGAKAGAVTGGALGGLGGLLVGLGALAIPGIGPVIAGGAVATALATTAAGAGIGAAAGGVTGGLVGLGIPENRAKVYNDRLNRGDYLIIVDGTDDEVRRAEAILKRHGIQEFDTFDAADTTGVHHRDSDRDIHPVVGAAPHTHRRRRAIGVFPNRRDAEVALTELRDAGFPLSQISLIAKDGNHNTNLTDTAVGRGNKADEGAKAGAVTGGALGGLGGLLVGLGALAIPGIGPVIAGGAVATALATTAAGAGIGAAAGGVTGGLVGLGIPENRAKVYNDRLNRGDYLIIVDGTDDEVRRAEAILKRHGIQEFDTFDAADTTGVHRHDSDRSIHHDAPVVNTTSTEHGVGYDKDDPAVIIVDHRNEKV
ncbi:general stress protein [Scytonema tolypothrichoides]|uniref:general stress protein n=1 Tax=Scytonema tolypothrichoides TaxID=1233230 RepID=UPI0038B5661C